MDGVRSYVMEVPHYGSQFIEGLSPTGQVAGRATGFFVKNRQGRTFLITNRHVVTGGERSDDDQPGPDVVSALRCTVPMQHERAGFHQQFVVELGDLHGRSVWLEHPSLGRAVDVVAVPLEWGAEEGLVDLVSYPLKADVARLDVTGTLFVIGFPMGFDPLEESVFGVWTRGTIAWPPGFDWRDLPCLLVDCRTRKGQSGSPVVFFADSQTEYTSVDGGRARGPAWNLVGVYSGRIQEDSDVGIVWKRSALEAVVEHGVRPDKWVAPLEEREGIETNYWLRAAEWVQESVARGSSGQIN